MKHFHRNSSLNSIAVYTAAGVIMNTPKQKDPLPWYWKTRYLILMGWAIVIILGWIFSAH